MPLTSQWNQRRAVYSEVINASIFMTAKAVVIAADLTLAQGEPFAIENWLVAAFGCRIAICSTACPIWPPPAEASGLSDQHVNRERVHPA